MFLEWDLELYDPATNQPAKCNSSDLNEELGQVSLLNWNWGEMRMRNKNILVGEFWAIVPFDPPGRVPVFGQNRDTDRECDGL